MKINKLLFLGLISVIFIFIGFDFVQASPNYCYTSSCQPLTTCGENQFDCSGDCGLFNAQCRSFLCGGDVRGCVRNCCPLPPTCTYVSDVTQWSAYNNSGLSYALTVAYTTTTNMSRCHDVATVRSCVWSNPPEPADNRIKFRRTSGTATYSNMDARCKAEFGSNWEFAWIDNADEAYIVSPPLYTGTRAGIKNIPLSYNPPFRTSSGVENDVCQGERNTWPEKEKWALLEIAPTAMTGNKTFCYSDVHREENGPFPGLCRNTTYNTYSPGVVCPAPTCTDGVQNGNETGIDTGGSCATPVTGACAATHNNCTSGTLGSIATYDTYYAWWCMGNNDAVSTDDILCSENKTPPPPTPTCSDGIKNQDETGVDTGGVCGSGPNPDPGPGPGPGTCNGICGPLCPLPCGDGNFNGDVGAASCPVSRIGTIGANNQVNINANTSWLVSVPATCVGCTVKWKVVDINNPSPLPVDGSSTWNKLFTTIGLKKISADIYLSGSKICSSNIATTTVVQQGGTSGEI